MEYNKSQSFNGQAETSLNYLQPESYKISDNIVSDSTDLTTPDTTLRFTKGISDTSDTTKGNLPADSLLLTSKNDSLMGMKDTIKVDSMKIDSTARLTHFKYRRKDSPVTSLYSPKDSRFFAYPSSRKKVVEIDSTGKFVELKEKVGDQITKIIIRIPFDEYIEEAIKARDRSLWDELVYKYELKDTKKDLSTFIKDITDFEIPLPSVGVLSIFGTPKISLRIGGAVDIHGAWRNETTEGITASRYGNTRNEPDFRQQVQINVNGTIGDKLQINADWNTERTFEYENQLKIKYTGYEDEIIQSIEAGNVSLQTSSLVGGSEALFGVKANFKLGPLNLTTLASQKKGEVKEKSVSGGSSSQEFKLTATSYSRNHYFLDSIYADTSASLNLFNKYYGNPTPQIVRKYFVKDIEVWKSINQTLRDPSERFATAYISLPDRAENESYPSSLRSDAQQEEPGVVVKGRFIRLVQDQDYILHPETGYITFKTQIQETDIIAVSYRYENDINGPEDDRFFGEFLSTAGSDTNQRLILKLIKPQNLQPSYKKAWSLLLKNIYAIGGRNIKKEGFELDITYLIESQDQNAIGGTKLLNAFGFDLVNTSDNPTPDGVFDFKPGLTILPETGEIIFPVLQPFGRSIPKSIPNYENYQFNAVYDTSVTFANQETNKNKFSIVGKFSGEATSVYQLGFNVVENSVKVTLNGRELSPGSDYSVDYNIGTLTIRNAAALVPGANLKITYEENDLFQIASKTLFGARGIVDISRDTKFGFSALTLSEQTLSDKVRIGEEPLSNSIYGIDFSTQSDLPFLTRFLDNIISTKEMSSFSLRGEVAYMSPDPNTKKSNILSDKGASIAYIDDFEGAKRIIPVGIGYTSWKDLSVPKNLNPAIEPLTNMQKMAFKAKSWWFNVLPSNVSVKEIWPDKSVARGDETVTVLDYVYQPDTAGTYNYNPNLTDFSKNWGGMMKPLSSTANNLVEENIEFIEFWAQVRQAPDGAKVYIDIGKISEDVIPNDSINTEDVNRNDAIDDNKEDVGLDGLNDDQERASSGRSDGDPSGDNFSYRSTGVYNPNDYFNINGTEGNAALTDVGRFPDTEDLNRNGNLDRVNSYYRYEIPLDTSRITNPFIAGGGTSGWYLYRIPLKEFKLETGNPSFTVVEHIRFFVTGASSRIHLRLAEFNLVGNQWQKLIKDDSVMSISVVNIEDNPEYTSPGGVQRERDRTRPDQEIYRNEQSLSLVINDLREGDSRQAIKYLFRPLDVFNYKEMKLFIHTSPDNGPSSISYFRSIDEYAADVFFRFGTDTNNYYEYRQPIKENPAEGNWNEIRIIFEAITAIKQARDSVNQEYRIPVPGTEGHYYIIKGSPSLTAIRFLSIGIVNRADNNPVLQQPISGEIWVNELRVIGADDTPGWAYSASSTLKFADLLTLNFNLSRTDPYFHRLSERFGSRNEARSWGVSADLDLLKIIPVNLTGSNLKLNYARTETVGKPRFLLGTDVAVEEAGKLLKEKLIREQGYTPAEAQKIADQLASDAQTISTSDTWTASNIKIKIPSNYWLIRDTFNSLVFGFNYNKSFNRNPQTLSSKSWIWNATMGYSLSLSPDYFFYPTSIPIIGDFFGLFTDYRNVKVYFTPQTITYNLAAKRNRSYNTSRQIGNTTSQELVSRDFTTTRGFSMNWKLTENGFLNVTTTYNFDVTGSLTYLETDQFNQQRSESKIWKDILTGAYFGKDNIFSQTFDVRTSPRLPSLWDINKNFTLTLGYNVRYQWNNDFRQVELGRGAGYSNRSSVGFTLRLKNLTAPLFAESESNTQVTTQPVPKQPDRRRDFENQEPKLSGDSLKTPEKQDTTTTASADTVKKISALTNALLFLRSVAKTLFFDYENIQINFSNDNSLSGSGVRGNGTGLKNFFGFTYNVDEGPSRLFMLGLTNDIGPRAKNGNLTDNFSQKNNIDIKTSRPLWEGAKIDLNWKIGWSINKSTSLQSDADGFVSISNITSTGSISRSFLSLPPFFLFSVFNSGIKRVNELYDPKAKNPTQNLSNAFVTGFESIPWLSKIGFMKDVANYIPRPNWRITWDGLEKFSIFKSFAKRVSLDHAYSSDYNEGWKLNPDGTQVVQTQKISYGFQPLIGLNLTFNELWSGNLTGSIKYSTRSNFDLGVTTKNITEQFSRDIGISLNYSKSGFEIPLFGVSLKNDIEFTFSYSSAQNSTVIYDMNKFTEEGTPQDGTVRTTLEPRIKYVISSRVTLSVFYKRSSTTPEGASRIQATTTNEAGLDVRISIQ